PQDPCNTDAPESSGNSNPTATSTNPPADQLETLTLETPIPTVSSPVPTVCFTNSQEPLSETRLISKKVTNQGETPSFDNILTLTNQFEDTLRVTTNLEESNGVEADEEGIDYDEVFAPVARIEAIRLFLAYASFIDFVVYQMDVKSTFLYGIIDEEAPRAWYGTLSKYLLKNGFQRGTIDQTLFIKKQREDFILVQVYVDDIIFRSSNPQLCREFEALMHEKFQMSAMGDILKKFRYTDVRSLNTPMDKENPWGKKGNGKDVDLHLYRFMIGSLMYLTASRRDIMFAVCACARHQVTPKECHLHAVKRIFRYLKGNPKLGLWYPKDSPFDLVSFSDSDYGGATQDRKSTTGVCQFLGRRLISWQCKKQTIVATSTTKAEYVAATSCCGQVEHVIGGFFKGILNIYTLFVSHIVIGWVIGTFKFWGVLRMLMISLRLIPLGEHNSDFHPIVDFLEASHLRYALTVKPTVYVSYIRQFWSTARIETTKERTKILATVDGIVRTISESSLRRNLKVRDKDGISSLLDAELFENLTLMGYNISSNQKFTFQKGQFSHQWKYLIHTIMQCLSPKSTGFNKFSTNIATALICLAINRTYNFSKMIFDGLVKNINNKGEGSGTPTEPHHTPSLVSQTPSHTTQPTSSPPLVSTTSIPTVTPTETTPIRQYTRRVRIAQSSTLPPVADEPVSPVRDVSQGEACPTDFSFITDQDRATIAKSSTLPYDSAPKAQEVEVLKLKERVKVLEDRARIAATRSGDDALINGRSMDEGEAATERISDDTEEMAMVLTSIDAAIVLAGGIDDVPTGSGFIPTAGPSAADIPTGSDVVPIASLVFATATVVTPYSRTKGKEVMVESDTLKKQRLQEQINAQVARELEEKQERERTRECLNK
nr:hypothetical protein [Tanacetum cinerariifolium]